MNHGEEDKLPDCVKDLSKEDKLIECVEDHGEKDRLPECVEDHGEEDKLAEEGDHQGGGRDDFCQQQEEHGQGQQDGDGETDLKNMQSLPPYFLHLSCFSCLHFLLLFRLHPFLYSIVASNSFCFQDT
jgi:hypothetical protein